MNSDWVLALYKFCYIYRRFLPGLHNASMTTVMPNFLPEMLSLIISSENWSTHLGCPNEIHGQQMECNYAPSIGCSNVKNATSSVSWFTKRHQQPSITSVANITYFQIDLLLLCLQEILIIWINSIGSRIKIFKTQTPETKNSKKTNVAIK